MKLFFDLCTWLVILISLFLLLAPPSYEESIFKGNNIKDAADNEHTTGIQDFTPRYPVWTFDTVNPQK